jgi:hypothetical protein
MSLVMMALRIAAVQALKSGGTLVGDHVLDSQISAIDLTADGNLSSDQERPFIAVYTETAKSDDLGSTGLRANGQIELTFNCGVSLTMAQSNKDTGVSEIIEGLPATDPQFEAILDIVGCQICRVLVDASNPWSQVFGGFVSKYVSLARLRSSGDASRVRLACGQLKITVEAFADPAAGAVFAEGSHWPKFLELMERDGVKQLGLFRQLLGEPFDGEYPNFEALTGMASRDNIGLKLYSFDGVPLATKIETAISEVDRD